MHFFTDTKICLSTSGAWFVWVQWVFTFPRKNYPPISQCARLLKSAYQNPQTFKQMHLYTTLWPVFQIFVQKYKKFTQESGQISVKATKGTKIAHNALEKIILP